MTIEIAAKSQLAYTIWVCMIVFCEGAHFSIVPTALKLIYGPQSAGKIYGVLFSFAAFANLILMILT